MGTRLRIDGGDGPYRPWWGDTSEGVRHFRSWGPSEEIGKRETVRFLHDNLLDGLERPEDTPSSSNTVDDTLALTTSSTKVLSALVLCLTHPNGYKTIYLVDKSNTFIVLEFPLSFFLRDISRVGRSSR